MLVLVYCGLFLFNSVLCAGQADSEKQAMFNKANKNVYFCRYFCQGYVLSLSAGWLICRQDYTKPTDQISMKLGWRTALSPE